MSGKEYCYLINTMDRVKARKIFDFKAKTNVQLPPKHILFINWHGKIGDAFVSSFMFPALRDRYPSVCISVITTSQLEKLYLDVFKVNQVFVLNQLTIESVNRILKNLKNVDTVIPLIGILDFYHIYVLGHIHPANILGIDPFLKMINSDYRKIANNMLVHDMYKNMLYFLGCVNFDDSYIIPKRNLIKKDFRIIINPFGSRSDKSLSDKKTIELLSELASLYPTTPIGVLSSPDTINKCEIIVKNVNYTNVNIVPGIETIFDVLPYLNGCSLVITVDTCIVHLAAGLKKRTIAIYYSISGEFNCWLPRNDANVKILYSHGTKQCAQKNMNNFNIKDLINETSSLLLENE